MDNFNVENIDLGNINVENVNVDNINEKFRYLEAALILTVICR